jgi:hypothetical protein
VAAPELTDGERRAGLALGALALAAFVALSGGRPLFLAVGLTMGIGLVLASARRTRVGAAFLSFVTAFGPWGFAAIFGVAYVGFALWLLARAGKVTPPAPSAGSAAARRGRGRAA